MKFEVNGQSIPDPTPESIAQAIPDRAPSAEWGVSLARDDEDSIEADGRADGLYDAAHVQGRRIFDAETPVDGRELRSLFTLFLNGDKSWRSRHRWKPYSPKPQDTAARFASGVGSLPRSAWVALASIIAIVGLPQFLPRISLPKNVLPEAIDSPVTWIVLGFFAVCVLVFLVAVLIKNREVRQAARWPSASATVVRSESGFALKHPPGGGMPENQRVAKIEYKFSVGGKAHAGNRVSLAEITPAEEVPAILARYPEGKPIRIYYNPSNPSESVIERDPPNIAQGCAILFAFGLAAVAGALLLIAYGQDMVHAVLPDAIVPLMAFAAVGSAAFFAFFVSIRRRLAAARTWPKTSGVVTANEISEYTTYEKSGKSRVARQSYMPIVEYTFKVLGKEFKSRNVQLDTQVGGSKSFAEKILAQYPVGKVVTVHYDPADPSQAALEFRGGISWLLLAIALLLLGAAALTSGVFGRILH